MQDWPKSVAGGWIDISGRVGLSEDSIRSTISVSSLVGVMGKLVSMFSTWSFLTVWSAERFLGFGLFGLLLIVVMVGLFCGVGEFKKSDGDDEVNMMWSFL